MIVIMDIQGVSTFNYKVIIIDCCVQQKITLVYYLSRELCLWCNDITLKRF